MQSYVAPVSIASTRRPTVYIFRHEVSMSNICQIVNMSRAKRLKASTRVVIKIIGKYSNNNAVCLKFAQPYKKRCG